MSFLPGMRPVPFVAAAGAAALPTVTFRGLLNDLSNTTSYSFSSVAIGAAGANRWVAVGVRSDGTVSAITVGGVSATNVADQTNTELWVANVTTGTTATVVVSTSSASRCSIGVWSMEDLSSGTPVDTAVLNNVSGGSLNMDTSADGIVIIWGFSNGSSFSVTAGATLDDQADVGEVGHRTMGASASGVAAATPRTITVSQSGGTLARWAAATFR